MLKKIISRYTKVDFIKNSFTLIAGIGIAQIIPILLQPFLRRMFSPEDFGAFAVYMSIVGILSGIAMFRYQMAIVLPKKDDEAVNVFVLANILNLIFAILITASIFIFKDQIVILLNFPVKYSYWLYLLPASIFLFSSYDAMNYWLIRKKAFKSSAVNKVARRTSEGIIQLFSGIFKVPIGLSIGDIAGSIANNISGIIQIRKVEFSFKSVSRNDILIAGKKYIDFPKNSIPALLNSAATLLPVLFINKIYSESITGYFDLSRLVLSVPGMLISVAISQVLLQKISEKRNDSLSIKKDLLQVFYVLTIIGFVEVFIISLFGPNLFSFVFGKNGTTSGVYSQILIFSYALKFIVTPFSLIFISLNKMKIISIWQIIYFATILILLFFKDLLFQDFLKIYVLIEIFSYTLYFILILITVRKYENDLRNNFRI